jgi:two-component system, OmpR family, sensor histidine kinase ArlS
MLLFTLQVTIIISLLAFFIYYFSSLERRAVFQKRLISRANYSGELFSILGDSNHLMLNQIDSTSTAGLLPQRSISIFNPDGHILYQFEKKAQNISLSKEILNEAMASGKKYFKIGQREAIALKYNDPRKPIIVIVVAYDEDGLLRLRELAKILLISLPSGVLLTALIGYLFSRQLVKPISQIIKEVDQISSYNLNQRVMAGSSRDELNQLANTFNKLLDRLQKSFNIQKRFISNASHELSTPLTSISSQLEVTLQRERDTSEYQKVLISIKEDVLQMRQLTRSLLEIAKADADGNIELKEVRMDEVLLKITSEVKKIESYYKVELNFGEYLENEKGFVIFGNVELLHSAIKNMVENGCKYSPDNTSRVTLSYENQRVYIRVKNKGNLIATEDIQKIFQPFYRGSNAQNHKGFGLGLSLARGIAQLHKGGLNVQSDISEGTIFTIDIPSINSVQ